VKELNLPAYSFKIRRNENGQNIIFDPARKKFVVLTPEEWVRQHFVRYMIDKKGYPEGLIGVEVVFKLNELTRRADILVYNRTGNPVLIVECKAPEIKINNKVFDQIVSYNIRFRLDYIIVTNGLDHYACKTDWEAGTYSFLKEIPDYHSIIE
jgi:hypothetical protein